MKHSFSRRLKQFAALIVFMSVCQLGFSHNKVVVIPLEDDQTDSITVNVGQDGEFFSDPNTALAFITQASFRNRYTLRIGPGVYNLTQPLEMKPYVNVVGSGIGKTILMGPSLPAVQNIAVISHSLSSLKDLTVKNVSTDNRSGTGIYHISFFADEKLTLSDIEVIVEGTNERQSGISIVSSITPRFGFPRGITANIENVSIKVMGGSINQGIVTVDGSLNLLNSSVIVLPGSSSEAGVWISTSGFPDFVYTTVDNSTLLAEENSIGVDTSFAGIYNAVVTSVNNSIISSELPQLNPPTCSSVFLPNGDSLNANCLLP